MSDGYDDIIKAHYRRVAKDHGVSPSSTMMDQVTRQLETRTIVSAIRSALAATRHGAKGDRVVADIGCGNGFTLEVLADDGIDAQLLGVEFTDELLRIAEGRLRDYPRAEVKAGDIRKPDVLSPSSVDIAICQRLLINLLDEGDQRRALANLVSMLRPGGYMICVEAFSSSLDTLNGARAEFQLDPIQPAHHNLYLPDDFFEHPSLEPCILGDPPCKPNFLSTYYYMSRVLFPALLGHADVPYNSHFVRLMAELLPQPVGDYSPLRLVTLRRADG